MPLQFTYQPPKINVAAVMTAKVTAAEVAGAAALLEATLPHVPRDSDQLADSGHVDPHSGVGAAVVFQAISDPSANYPDGYNYGIRVHEDEAMNHPNGGKAHFLSDTMRTDGPAVLAAAVEILRF